MAYIVDFGFQEWVLDIPSRSQEGQNKGRKLQLSSHFKFIWRHPGNAKMSKK
jgi:P pilus assembly chaperone PapD